MLTSAGSCVLRDLEGGGGGEWGGDVVACLLLNHPLTMKDVVLVLVTMGFFAVAWAYTRALDRL
jgi:hypothetical protein